MSELPESELIPSPDPYTAVRALVESLLTEMYVCLPGVVEKWDSANPCKCDVSPTIQRVYRLPDEEGNYAREAVDQPVITDVPIQYPRGGGYAITFPLKKGDPVLLVFSQRSLDVWMASDGATPVDPEDVRKFDITDAFCIPGLSTGAAPIATASEEDLVIALEDGSSEIRLKADGTIGMGPEAAEALALASVCNSRLDAIESWANSHIHDGPPTATPLTPGGGDTSSTRTFVDA